MPIYVYKNLNTNEKFELEQRITEPALTHHPETGDPVKRLIQPVGIAFKGSGFYVNDTRSSNSSSTSVTAKSSGSATTETAKTDNTKTENKKSESADSNTKKAEKSTKNTD